MVVVKRRRRDGTEGRGNLTESRRQLNQDKKGGCRTEGGTWVLTTTTADCTAVCRPPNVVEPIVVFLFLLKRKISNVCFRVPSKDSTGRTLPESRSFPTKSRNPLTNRPTKFFTVMDSGHGSLRLS